MGSTGYLPCQAEAGDFRKRRTALSDILYDTKCINIQNCSDEQKKRK
jgi:hypothetical protein